MTEEEWSAATNPRPMLEWLLGEIRIRKRKRFAYECIRRVAPLLNDPRGEIVLGLLDQTAEGNAGWDELSRHVESLQNDAHKNCRPTTASFQAVSGVTCAVLCNHPNPLYAIGICWMANARAYAEVPDPAVVEIEGWGEEIEDAGWDAAFCRESLQQAVLLREIVGNPFCPIRIDRTWLNLTVVRLAQAAYADPLLSSGLFDNHRLAVLADALEDAGCDSKDLLGHLRGGGEHVRGCWAVDLLLGKE